MSSKSKLFGKKLLIAFVVLIGIAAIVFAVLHMAYRPTDDKDRITNETDIKLSVETSKETASPFIKTYDAEKFSSLSESKQMKIRSSTCGKVEGDVPFVSLKNKKDSYVKISLSLGIKSERYMLRFPALWSKSYATPMSCLFLGETGIPSAV